MVSGIGSRRPRRAIHEPWVFNSTKESVLAPALFHPAMDASGEMLPRTDAATVLFALLVVCAIVSDKMWARRR